MHNRFIFALSTIHGFCFRSPLSQPVEGKVAAVSSTVSSIGNNESQALSPESTASVPPPRRSNVTGEDAIPLHSSSASQGSSTGSSEKSEPWEIDARRRQNPLAPPAYDTPGLVGKARSRGDSSVDNNAYGRRWVAGRPLVVPRTTAEAIAMNREALRRQEASRSAGGEQSQGGQDGLGPSQEASSLGGAAHKMASDFGSRIETCRLHRQRSKIIKVWEVSERLATCPPWRGCRSCWLSFSCEAVSLALLGNKLTEHPHGESGCPILNRR